MLANTAMFGTWLAQHGCEWTSCFCVQISLDAPMLETGVFTLRICIHKSLDSAEFPNTAMLSECCSF